MFALAQAAMNTLMDSMAQKTDISFITEAGVLDLKSSLAGWRVVSRHCTVNILSLFCCEFNTLGACVGREMDRKSTCRRERQITGISDDKAINPILPTPHSYGFALPQLPPVSKYNHTLEDKE